MTPQLPRLATLCGLLLLSGAVLGRFEAVVLGAPLLAMLVTGLLRRPATVSAGVRLSALRVIEGDEVSVVARVRTDRRVDQLTIDFGLPAGFEVVRGSGHVTVTVGPDSELDVAVTVRPQRWGVYSVGPTSFACYSRDRLHVEGLRSPALTIRVVPRADRFAGSLVQPFQRVLVGSHQSRAAGEGVEFAGIREFRPGDPLRRVNWRVGARYGGLHVTQHRPERNAEVVLFLDTFVDPGRVGHSALDTAVRAALGIAGHYLRQMDRVGVVGFGGVIRWLTPGTGVAQLYRITEHLLGAEVVTTHAAKAVSLLPRTSLPPGSLVIGLSPLLDERATAALMAISRRGHGVLVVDTAPYPLFEPVPERARELAQRLFVLNRAAVVARMSEAGVPVVRWTGAGALDAVLAQLSRLHARPKVVRR
ncbi:MAG TPA: DUF58 domain-containing protein [Mycobacteriales bacterium]|jgi:uncharacterized protein (DUF58 family)|nr:DUF58 domain-containing protein [Mycobacteriales bacterium]